MASFSYSLSSDFGGNINMRQFHDEINSEVSITPSILGVSMNGDDIQIEFDSSLNTTQQTTLDGLVSSHSPMTTVATHAIETVYPEVRFTKSSTYEKIGTFNYAGSVYGTINFIKVAGYMDNGCDSYDIKVYDLTNNNIISETNFTNDEIAINNMGNLNNIPNIDSLLEVHIKKNGGNAGKKVYVQSISLYLK